LNKKDQEEDSNVKGKIIDSNDIIKFENVVVYTPGNVKLAEDMNFDVVVGKNTIITGPNGSGKSR
jgi:ABC-type uncharacterized transport system fused permease/ATPase subunit